MKPRSQNPRDKLTLRKRKLSFSKQNNVFFIIWYQKAKNDYLAESVSWNLDFTLSLVGNLIKVVNKNVVNTFILINIF